MQKPTSSSNLFLFKTLAGAAGLALTSPAWALFQPVPEPNTFALIGAGVVSAILIARYKAKK